MNDVRKAFTDTLLGIAKENADIVALATDSRGSATLAEFAEQLPEQFIECGIAEQDAVGIAAGVALAGKRPFVCGPACFYSLRSAEQVKIDVAYSKQNVKIVGVSGGISYGALGTTHHATQDIALMRAISGIEIYLPSDARQMRQMTKYLASSNTPAYIRMGRGSVPDVYEDDACFVPGKANILLNGKKAAIIACGEMVAPALAAAKAIGDVMVLDMHTIKPIDEEAVLLAAETGLVVTVEEHSIFGGLGSAVAEVLSQKKPTKMKILGLPDEPVYHGSSAEIKAHYGLDKNGIAHCLKSMIGNPGE